MRFLCLALVASVACVPPEDEAPAPRPCWFDLAYRPTDGTLWLAADSCGRPSGVYVAPPNADLALVRRGNYFRLAIPSSGADIIATNTNSQLVRFDSATGDLRASSLSWASNLGELVVTPDDRAVWVTFWGGPDSGVGLFDVQRLADRGFVPVAGDPVGLALLPDGRTLATAASGRAEVTLVDGPRFREGPAAPTLGALDVALVPGASLVAVLEDRQSRIALYDAQLTLVGTLATGPEPRRLAVSPDGAWLAVTEKDAGELRVFDLATQTQAALWPVGRGPDAVVLPDADRAWVGLEDEQRVVEIGLGDGRIRRSL